jgi:hypothetical protein
VTIDGNAVVTGKVKGASGRSRDKTNNKVYINKGSVTGNVYGAYLDDSGNYFNSDDPNSVWYDGGNTNSNEVHISDGTVSGKAIGGLVGSNVTGNATGNSVAVSGGTVTGDVDGGYTGNGGNVTGNSVTIEGGTVSTVTGGASFGESGNSGDAVSNSVSLSAGSVGSIYGGYSEGKSYNGGAVTGNTVTITGGSVGTNARGGGSFSNTALSGNATNNTVTVSEETGTTTIGGFIVGGITMTSGQSGTAGNANENTVTIRGGTIGGYVMGGDVYSESGTGGVANKNKVTITAGTVSGNVSGGVGISGATGNTVTISGSSQINDTIYGGYTEGGKANDNVITVSDTAKAMNGIQAGYSRNNDAENNTVTVNNGTVGGYIFGGVATGNAKNNRIIVNDGTVSYLEGGSAAESATGNTIEVNGGTVNDTICGGNSNAGTVSGNTVTISGGTVNSGIIGGYTNDGTANDNTVNLKGTADLSNASLSGSNKTDSTGNELHVGGVKGGTDSKDTIFASGTDNKVRRVENFDTVALHSVNWSTSVAALEATTMTNIGTLDIKNLKFYEGGSEKTVFENDEEMALLKNTNSDLSTVTLTYNGGTGVAITTEGVVISGSTEEQTEETGVGGVKLTTQGGNETVKLSADSKAINYTKVTGSVKGITFGEATFTKNGVARDLNGLTFAATNTVDAAGLTFATANGAIAVNDGMTLAANATGVTTEVANNTEKTVAINYTDAQGIAYGATASGTVTSDGTAVSYTVDAVTLSSVDLANWNGTTAGVPDSWSAQVNSVAVNNADAITVVPTATQPILIAGSSMFADVNVAKEVAFDPVTQNGVTLTGTRMNTIKTTQTNVANDTITYELGAKNVQTVDIGEVAWGGAALDGSSADYNYGAAAIGTGNFGFTNPEQVEADTPMTLLQANETLTAIVNEEKAKAYSYTPVAGVTVDGNITGQMSRSGNNVVFTATENRATQLTFRDVEWKDTLMTRPANITFAGANVDTSAINFTNINELAAESRMTLVSDFGNTVGTITGNRYTLGSGLQGEGAASLSGNDLIFTANTAAESLTPTEATHETVMAMDAGTAVLSTGREYVDSAIEGLGLVTNIAPDGTATFASMGGGANRYKTGSHVDTHSWNAIVAVGSKREHKKGDLEWGVFAEYGRGNYTLHDDNGGRGDGDTHYAGGGLLAKWTNKHNVYTEASIRLGRMSDSAKNMLTDNLGNSYGYNVHANYFGGHIGVGKIFKVKGNHDLDVYGKFFYTRRNGVNFDAGVNHYDLDSVASSLLRVGARYGSNDKKWNWYGGLAYEYEFDGESTGTVSTGAVSAAIRSASIKGSSVRGELGVRMEATKTNPWKADIGIYAYGGRHRGFGGTVTVMYMF